MKELFSRQLVACAPLSRPQSSQRKAEANGREAVFLFFKHSRVAEERGVIGCEEWRLSSYYLANGGMACKDPVEEISDLFAVPSLRVHKICIKGQVAAVEGLLFHALCVGTVMRQIENGQIKKIYVRTMLHDKI